MSAQLEIKEFCPARWQHVYVWRVTKTHTRQITREGQTNLDFTCKQIKLRHKSTNFISSMYKREIFHRGQNLASIFTLINVINHNVKQLEDPMIIKAAERYYLNN